MVLSTTFTVLLVIAGVSVASESKRIRVEVKGLTSCALEDKTNTWAMLELFLDRSQRAVNYFDAQYGSIELGADYDLVDGNDVTPRVKVTHNCFSSKIERTFIITLDPVHDSKTITIPNLELKDLQSFSFMRA